VGSAEDYFMAGRSFGTFVLFMSLFGTNVTAFALVSMPGISYHAGIGAFGFFGAVAAFVTAVLYFNRLPDLGTRQTPRLHDSATHVQRSLAVSGGGLSSFCWTHFLYHSLFDNRFDGRGNYYRSD